MKPPDFDAIQDGFRRADALLRRLGDMTESYELVKSQVKDAIAASEMDFNRKKNNYEVTTAQRIAEAREVLDKFREEQGAREKAARAARESVLLEMEKLRNELRVLGIELDLNPGVRNRL